MTALAEPATAAAPAEPPRRRLDPDVVVAGVAALVFQVVLTVVGAVAERAFSPLQQLASGRVPAPPSLLQHTDRWDAGYFRSIDDGLYHLDPQSQAFYPLFPLLVRGVELMSFGLLGFLAAGLVLNTLATWVAATALLKITRWHVGEGPAVRLALVVMLTAPTAFYLHVFYSEATFTALGLAAYALALRGRWAVMGGCLMLLTASRITSVLFVGLCFLEFWRAGGWRFRALLTPAVLWFPAAAAGFGAFSLYLHLTTGDALGMFTAYDAGPYWSFHVFDPNIFATIGRAAEVVLTALRGSEPFSHYTLVDQVLPLVGLAGLVGASVYLLVTLRGDGVPLGVFGFVSTVMFTLNSNLVSVHRYLLPTVTIYVACALLADRTRHGRTVVLTGTYVGVLLQGLLLALFVSNFWAG